MVVLLCWEEHHMTTGYIDNKDAMLRRLARVEGQVRGLQRMVDSDTYCRPSRWSCLKTISRTASPTPPATAALTWRQRSKRPRMRSPD